MSKGLDNLKHIVVLMMENRSFDHMLGGLKEKFPKINGLTGNESNQDSAGSVVQVSATADYRGQLSHDPDHHFPGVDVQIYGGAPFAPGRVANMQGFVKSYGTQGPNVQDSHAIMKYFSPERIPVLTKLATEYAVFNGWFSSIPGPTICNRAFAHYGTSFGNVDMNMFLVSDAARAKMPEYSFVEPNYSDHPAPDGTQLLATDQHPDHHVLAGDNFIGKVYDCIRINPKLWQSTALLIVYDEHGGLYDHVNPPSCTPDGFEAPEAATQVPGLTFKFDRLGIRVPAVLVSPYIARGTVVPGTEDPANERIFEHASIPATVSRHFLNGNDMGTPREQQAETFLDLLGDKLRPDNDCVFFPKAMKG
jgi:phospholipase C